MRAGQGPGVAPIAATWFTAVLAAIGHRLCVDAIADSTKLETGRLMSILRTSAARVLAITALLATGMHVACAETVALKRERGAFVLPVVINGQITRNFMVDSGASDVTIPADVVAALSQDGTISTADFLDPQVYQLADGSVTRTRRVRIRSLRVGSVELKDVVVSVVPHAGVLLLGQSFLGRLQSWTIDNQRHLFVINESLTDHPAGPQVAAQAAPDVAPQSAPRIPPRSTPRVAKADDAPMAAQWLAVGQSRDGLQRLYVNSSSVHVTDGIPRAWFKTVYSPHTIKGIGEANKWMSAVLVRDAFNCEAETGRTEQATEFYDDGTKFTVPTAALRRSWTAVQQGTGFNKEMGVLCKLPDVREPRRASNNP